MKATTNPATSEETLLQNNENQPSKTVEPRKKHLWKDVLIGGIPGIVLGSAGTAFAANRTQAEEIDENTTTPHEHQHQTSAQGEDLVPDDVKLSTSVNDDMSFGEAYAAARADIGAGGVFEWHGQLYSTYSQGEWESMTDEQKTEFAEGVADVERPHTDPVGTTASSEGQQETAQEESQTTAQDNSESQPGTAAPATETEVTSGEFEHHGQIVNENGEPVEVEVVEAGRVDVGDGESVAAVHAHVDGHDAAFVDVDDDGYVDAILVDANDDGELQEGEVIDTQDTDLHMTEFASAETFDYNTPEDDLFAQAPDYTNDADVSDLA